LHNTIAYFRTQEFFFSFWLKKKLTIEGVSEIKSRETIETRIQKPENKELFPSGTFFTAVALLEIFAALFFLLAAVGINAQWRCILQE
jgi:hypothetical protein